MLKHNSVYGTKITLCGIPFIGHEWQNSELAFFWIDTTCPICVEKSIPLLMNDSSPYSMSLVENLQQKLKVIKYRENFEEIINEKT